MALNLPLDDLERRIGALVLETWAQQAEIQRLQRQVQGFTTAQPEQTDEGNDDGR